MPELPEGAKSAHSEVNYGPSTDGERCGNCRHFIAPNRCESVASPVRKSGWCIRWAADLEAKAA